MSKLAKTNRKWGGGELAASLLAVACMAAVPSFADSTAIYRFNWYAGSAVADFPAPMTLREGLNGFTYTGFAADGSDLRVKDEQGNLLPHEIEKWDPSGFSIVWVKLPSLSQSATVTLSWGDAEAATADGSLWGDALHVFHFGDNITKDSSKWGFSSSKTPDAGAGIVGSGMTSASSSDKRIYIDNITPSSLGVGSKTPYTISFWLKGKADSYDNYLCEIRKSGGGSPDTIITYNYNNNSTKALRTVELISAGPGRASTRIVAPDYGWHHFAYTYDGTTIRMYLDGEETGTVAASQSLASWESGTLKQCLTLGAGYWGGNSSGATFDEFRLEPVCRDATWIKALALTPAQVHDNDDVYVLLFPEYTGTETLTDFPLMVTLDDRLPGLPDSVKKAMRDINRLYFYTADGQTELPYEMELTPTESGTAATYWVRVPEFGPGTTLRVQTTPTKWTANQSTVTSRFWAGDAGAVNTNVWADGTFLHVYHLAVGRYRFDSVPFGGDLKESWSDWRATCPGVDGPTGRYGAMHSTTNTGMRTLLGSGSPGITNRYTISFWARKDAADFADPQPSYFLQMRQKDTGDTQWGILAGFHGDGNMFKLWKNGISAHKRCIEIPDTDWHHYAFTCDGTVVRGYRDGVAVMTDDPLDFNMPDLGNCYVTVGGATGAPNRECFRGDIDEFRMEDEPRSADWIKACYQTQFARRGTVARLSPPAFGKEVKATASTAGTITFSADLVCRIPSTLTIHYGAIDGGTDASSWTASTPLGTVGDGRVAGTVIGLAADQGVVARFRAVNAYGEAWSAPIMGRAIVNVKGMSCNCVIVTNLAKGVTLKDFPLCVRIPASLNPPASPATLRFVGSNGLPLSHEVETWDATGESIVWVRVPEAVKGTKVRMLWGSAFTAMDAPVSSVWNGDYESVYHMASQNDSSASALHFTSDKTPTNGMVGAGRKMGASGGLMTEAHLVEGTSGPFTFSGWLCGYATMGNSYVLLKCIGGTSLQLGVLFGYEPMTLQLYMNSSAHPSEGSSTSYYSEMRYTHSPIVLPDEGWHHFAYTYDGAVFGVYLDGALVRSVKINVTQCGRNPSLQMGTLRVGRAPGGGDLFKGGLDELRLETVGRSAEWIKACYDDQRGGLTAIRFYPAGTLLSVK